MLDIARAKKEESEKWEARLQEAQTDLKRLVDEAREREDEFAEQAHKQEQEHRAARKALEDKYDRLQEEYDALHSLLGRTQEDLEKKTADLSSQKKNFEAQVSRLKKDKNNIEAEKEQTISQLQQQTEELQVMPCRGRAIAFDCL